MRRSVQLLFRPEPVQADKVTALGTRRIFNEDHDMLRELARKFFRERVEPHHHLWEEVGHVPRELWQEAGELGILNCTMPAELGGSSADILSAAVIWEEQAYTLCTGPGFSLHSEIVSPYILNYGTEEQKQRFLPELSSGKKIGAIAMSEPAAGSDLQGIKTTCFPNESGDLILRGSKTFITNGYLSDVVIVVCKTDPNAKGAHGISLVIVEEGMQGFSKGKPLKKLGLKAQDTCELFFDDVVIPKENVLGDLNAGFKYLMSELPQERLLIAALSMASAEANFEETREYVHERKAFGGPLIKMQLLRHRMARLKTKLAVNRAFVDQCLDLHNQKKLDNSMASMVKAAASELQNEVADECVQLHGGYGFIWDYSACRNYADARVQNIYGGTNEIMMELVSRTI